MGTMVSSDGITINRASFWARVQANVTTKLPWCDLAALDVAPTFAGAQDGERWFQATELPQKEHLSRPGFKLMSPLVVNLVS